MKKKSFYYSFIMLLMAIVSAGVVSCGSDDETPEAYITGKQLAGTWKATYSNGDMYITCTENGSWTSVMYQQNADDHITEHGLYSLRRANEHYLGLAYNTDIVVDDEYDYKPFEWIDSQHKKFRLDGILYEKQ